MKLFLCTLLYSNDNYRAEDYYAALRLQQPAVLAEERDLPRVLEPAARLEMKARNGYNLLVVWATLIGLIVMALALKVPLG